MNSIPSNPRARVYRNSAPVVYALAWLCTLMPACASDRDPATMPEPDDDMESDVDSSTRSATEGRADAAASGSRILDAALASVDAARKTGPVDGSIGDSSLSRGDGGDASAAADGAAPPALAGDARTLQPPRPRDAGLLEVRDAILPPLPADQGADLLDDLGEDLPESIDPAMLQCAGDLAGCVIAEPLQIDLCLEQLSTCNPIFDGDAGTQASCATRLAACVLREPLALGECLRELTSCEDQP